MVELKNILKRKGIGNKLNLPNDVRRIVAEGISAFLNSESVISLNLVRCALEELVDAGNIKSNVKVDSLTYSAPGGNAYILLAKDFNHITFDNAIILTMNPEQSPEIREVKISFPQPVKYERPLWYHLGSTYIYYKDINKLKEAIRPRVREQRTIHYSFDVKGFI